MNNLSINIIVMSIFILFLFSCKKKTENIEQEFIRNSIEQIKLSKEFKWIVILPGTGCHGCIQEAESFMKNNIANKDILFILTNTSSLKILQQKTDISQID